MKGIAADGFRAALRFPGETNHNDESNFGVVCETPPASTTRASRPCTTPG